MDLYGSWELAAARIISYHLHLMFSIFPIFFTFGLHSNTVFCSKLCSAQWPASQCKQWVRASEFLPLVPKIQHYDIWVSCLAQLYSVIMSRVTNLRWNQLTKYCVAAISRYKKMRRDLWKELALVTLWSCFYIQYKYILPQYTHF